jgi:hypothetical protein
MYVERGEFCGKLPLAVQRNQREIHATNVCKVTPENWKKMQKFGVPDHRNQA